jgi:hypothetical protein
MYKIVFLLLFLLSILICPIDNEKVFAAGEEQPSYEKIYLEVGYKTVNEALKEFEKHFQKNLKLPLRVPPIQFTHFFGRFNDLEGDANDSFEMEVVNDQMPENHYVIEVRPLKHKIKFKERYIVKTFILNNGIKADYVSMPSRIRALVFEEDGWQYRLMIDSRITEKVTPEILVNIANSIDYDEPKSKVGYFIGALMQYEDHQ